MLYFSLQAIRLLSSSVASSSSGRSKSVLVPYVATVIPQVITAAISLIASSAMVFMISRTEKGLTTPYRRIIFGLCVSDILQSFAFLTGPFLVPSDLPDSWGLGNDGTCQTTGFLLTFGMSAVPMYTCFLCWYYLCKLKHRTTNEAFRQKYEWKIHMFIIGINLIAACAGLALNLYHPIFTKAYCSVAAVPTGCRMKPEVVGECDPVIKARGSIFILLDSMILNMLCLFGIVGIMIMLLCHVLSISRISMPPTQAVGEEARYSSSYIAGEEDEIDRDDQSNEEARERRSPDHSRGYDQDHDHNNERQSLTAQENARNLSVLYRKESFLQAKCYVGAFCLAYVPAFVLYGTVIAGKIPPKWMQVVPFIFYPLGGLFNILVYTRPQTANLHRQLPEKSRLQCLWLVLKAGGEMPETEVEETNNENDPSSNYGNGGDPSHIINMLGLHDIDDPSFSFPIDFTSIDTPPFVFSPSNPSIGSSRRGTKGGETSPRRSPRTTHRFYKWPFLSKETSDSIWCGVSARSKSMSSKVGRLSGRRPVSLLGFGSGSGSGSTIANKSFGNVANINGRSADGSLAVVGGDSVRNTSSMGRISTGRSSFNNSINNNTNPSMVNFPSTRLSSHEEVSPESLSAEERNEELPPA